MKIVFALASLVLLAGCAPGYPSVQTCTERDVKSGYCIKAEFSCKRWTPGANMLVYYGSEARCV